MVRYLTLSVSMPPEMADQIDEEAKKHGMKTAPYIRQIIREHESTPFECNDPVLCVDGNGEKSRKEGAA